MTLGGAWRAAIGAVAGAAALAAPSASAAERLTGTWITADRSAQVRVAQCGSSLCGTIVRVLARGVPTADANNPDRRLRSRPLVGLQVLHGFVAREGEWVDGRAYDPQTGNSYRAKLSPGANGTLTVTGCVLFVCKSQRWTRG